ncbi:MAG: glutamate:GABA antiporter [Verrucomicrobiota bacterium]|jgi:amino acid transporter
MIRESAPQLERALTLRDLVLFNLVAVVGIPWVATAAKAGPSSLTLWLLAALLFFIPQGLAVIQLSSSYPDEGGIYAWTKREFGEGHGFLCGWCYWINNVLFYPTLLLSAAVTATYVIGRGESGLADNWSYVLPFTLIALTVAVGLNIVGVGTGKWLQNIGGLSVYLPGILLVLLGLHGALTRPPANAFSYSLLKPDLTNLPLLNLWATIAFAFAGLELSSTMGHEIRNPRRNLPRSIYIAAPLVALVYLCGTGSMLWLVPQGEINIVAGPLQGLANGMRNLGSVGWWVIPLAALLLTLARVGALGAWLTGSARVAFVVGLDRYFPPAFARIHPRWHTPYLAILIQAPIAVLFLLLSVLGKGTSVERAFLILLDMSLLIYFIPYLYLFLSFMAHCWRRAENPAECGGSTGSRPTSEKLLVPGGATGALIIGLCGVSITLLAMIVALIPPPGTADILIHEAKVGGGALLLVLLGWFIYWRAKRNA